MEVRASRLPRLLMVLVLAFSPYERHPLVGAVELFRGLAIQLSYRWAAGRVLAGEDDRAVLLWTVCGGCKRPRASREVLGVLMSVATGIALFLASNTVLLLAVGELMTIAGATAEAVGDVRFGIIAVRLTVTAFRAFQAYRHDSRLMGQLPAQTCIRWRIDYLAASPARAGHGGSLLERYLMLADEQHAEVVLSSDSRNRAFYASHGFQVATEFSSGDQMLLLRPPLSRRRARDLAELKAGLQGYKRKTGEGAP